jgi:hypothetical protein
MSQATRGSPDRTSGVEGGVPPRSPHSPHGGLGFHLTCSSVLPRHKIRLTPNAGEWQPENPEQV